MIVLQTLVRCVEEARRGEGQVLDRETWTGESWPDQTLDTGFLSAVMSVGLNCVSRASY